MKKNSGILWAGCIAGAVVLTAYLGLFLLGKWTNPSASTAVYSKLATGFLKGHLYLDEQPSPELLALPDPYNPKARKGITIPVDVSLYGGRFYYYWGPVPALIAALEQSILPFALPDNLFVLAFVTGSFIFRSCILILVWRRFFSGLPGWALGLGILVAGLTGVSTWMLHRPLVYQAATTGGEFFFVAGLYFVFSALLGRTTMWKFLLAGLFWAGAIGTRLTQALPIAFMSLMILVYLGRQAWSSRTFSRNLSFLFMLGIPLVLALMGIAWYNYARFGSISETGFSYALSGPNLQHIAGAMFSPHYMIQNLYNYFARSYRILDHFPFVYYQTGRLEPIFSFYLLPKYYYVEKSITGLFYSAPILLFSLLPLYSVLRSSTSKDKSQFANVPAGDFDFRWIVISLWGSFVVALILILSFFWAAARYAADFISPAILLAVLGFWLIQLKTGRGPAWQVWARYAAIVVCVYSIVITSILALLWRQGLFFA